MRKTRAKTRKHHFLKVVEGRRSEVKDREVSSQSRLFEILTGTIARVGR